MRFARRSTPTQQAETATLPDVLVLESPLLFLYSWTCACAFDSALASSFLLAASSSGVTVPSPLVSAVAINLVAVSVSLLPPVAGGAPPPLPPCPPAPSAVFAQNAGQQIDPLLLLPVGTSSPK
jgi:hypothetical protein